MLRHRKVVGAIGVEHDLGCRQLDRVDDPARRFAGQQQGADLLDIGGLVLADQRVDQLLALGLAHHPGVGQQRPLALGGPALRHRVDLFALDKDRDDIAGHLVDRVPARPDRDVERPRIDDVMGVVPADRVADFDDRARAIGLVAGRIGAVEEHPVLDIDHAGEHELR